MSKSKWRGPSQARIKPDRTSPSQAASAPAQPDPQLEASRAEIGAPLSDQERRRRTKALAATGHKPSKFGAEKLTPEEQVLGLADGTVERMDLFKDGTVKAKGRTINGVLTGYWEWYRRDGTKLRSGYFDAGNQVGKWTTYDANGDVYKVTQMRTGTA